MFKKIQKIMTLMVAIAIVCLTTLTPIHTYANQGLSLEGLHIVVDPGHGGSDPGATTTHNGVLVKESDEVLEISLLLQSLLNQTGMTISMTRTTDIYVSVNDRAAFANRVGADIFVSVHLNSFDNPSANGTETYYFNPQAGRSSGSQHHGLSDLQIQSASSGTRAQNSQLLAEKTQARMLTALGLRDRGVKHGNFAVIRETNMAAILVEPGFLSNPQDREVLLAAGANEKMAQALYLGILDYLVAQGYQVPGNLYDLGSSTPPSPSPTPTPTPDQRQGQTTANLNVRTGAGTNHSIVTTLPNGTPLTILAEQNGWFNIKSGDITGWVSAQYVKVTNGGPSTPTPPTTPTDTTREGKTTANLNLRTGAGTNHSIIRTLPQGTALTILSESNGWMRVRAGNTEGWVSADYVQVTNGQAPTPTPPASTTREGQTTANLNLRTGAGTNHSIIRTLPQGTALTILSESNGWMRVQVGNTEGWVSADYVRVTNGQAPTPTPPTATTREGQTTANLNLRTGAGSNHSIIRTLPQGTALTILSESNGWMRVKAGNTEGWVSADYVRVTNGQAPTPTPPASTTREGQTTANLNLRTGAGINHSIIRTLPQGTALTILSESNGWMRVKAGNTEGWVSADYVRVTNGNTQTPPASTTREGQTTANLNLRTGAGTNHSIIRTLPQGTALTILSESNGWMRVRAGNTEGWVSAEFVR